MIAFAPAPGHRPQTPPLPSRRSCRRPPIAVSAGGQGEEVHPVEEIMALQREDPSMTGEVPSPRRRKDMELLPGVKLKWLAIWTRENFFSLCESSCFMTGPGEPLVEIYLPGDGPFSALLRVIHDGPAPRGR